MIFAAFYPFISAVGYGFVYDIPAVNYTRELGFKVCDYFINVTGMDVRRSSFKAETKLVL